MHRRGASVAVALSPTSASAQTSSGAEVALADVTQVSAGDAHTCGRLGNSQIRCWGDNDYGSVGDGTTITDRPVPVAVQL